MNSVHLSAPTRFSIQENAQQLSIVFKLTRLEHYLGVVTLLGFMFYVSYFMIEPFESVDAFWQSELVIFLALAWVVLGTAWVILLSRILNTITISADKKVLKISKSPLPLWDNHTFIVQDIAQLYVTRHKTSSYKVHYHLILELKSGDYKYIVNRFMDYEEVLFLERKIEGFLGIQNVQHKDEYDPKKKV